MGKQRRKKQKSKPVHLTSLSTPNIVKDRQLKKKKTIRASYGKDQKFDPGMVKVADGEASSSNAVGMSKKPVSKSEKVNEKDDPQNICGFIFMCNGRTKSECFKHHVFGLPAGKVDTVKKIKSGASLFLYDFELKLLYGIYEATSNGKLGLEPGAFQGKFPAQVRFNVYKDCLPLPESSFKRAIQGNYDGVKFRQDLSRKQVKDLKLLFRPVAGSLKSYSAPYASNPDQPPRSFTAPVAREHIHPLPRLSSFRDQYMSSAAQVGGSTVTVLRSTESIPPFYDHNRQTSRASLQADLSSFRDPYMTSAAKEGDPTVTVLRSTESIPSSHDHYRQITRMSRTQSMVDPQNATYRAPYRHLSAIFDQAESHEPFGNGASYDQGGSLGIHQRHSSSYDQNEAHPPNVPENTAMHVENPYRRYGVLSEMTGKDQVIDYGREYAAPQLTKEEEKNSYKRSVGDQYSQNTLSISSATSHAMVHSQASPYAPSFELQSSRHLVSSSHQQPRYFVASAYENPTAVRVDPISRSVRVFSAADIPVSSHYSFAGASYR